MPFEKNAADAQPTEIDFESSIPLYAQLERILSAAIARKELKEGELIPTEAELCARYGVSRITVRKAVSGLASEGLLSSRRGKGTRVNAPRFIDETHNLMSFAEKTGTSAEFFGTRVLETKRIAAGGRIAAHMGIREGQELIYVKRLRFFNGMPIGLFENYLLSSIGLDVGEDFGGSIYALIEKKCGIAIKEAKRELTSVLADKETAALLELELPFPLLSIRTYSHDASSRVVEYSEGAYRTDRYQFVVRQDRASRSAP